MRIVIDISAANDPDAHRWLDRILHRIEDGWHVWDLTDTPDAEAIEATPWASDLGRQGNRLRELLVAATQRSAWTLAPHTRRLRVTALPVAPDELAPEQASRLADEPLVILVENRDSDGAFVARIVTELDKSLHGVWRREGEPIRFDSVGGVGQMREEIETQASARLYRPRLVAVVDSDRKGPADSESEEARRLRKDLRTSRPALLGTRQAGSGELPAAGSPRREARRRRRAPKAARSVGPTQRRSEGLLRHEARPAGGSLAD